MIIDYSTLQKMDSGITKLSDLEIDDNLEMGTYSITSNQIQGNLQSNIQLNQIPLMNGSHTQLNPNLYDSGSGGGESSTSTIYIPISLTYEGTKTNSIDNLHLCEVIPKGLENAPQDYFIQDYTSSKEGEAYLACDTDLNKNIVFVNTITQYTIPSQLVVSGMVYPIREVKSYTFYGNDSSSQEEIQSYGPPLLESLVLSHGIQIYSLQNPCRKLKLISFPNTIEVIQEHVFDQVPSTCNLYMTQALVEKLQTKYPNRFEDTAVGTFFDRLPIEIIDHTWID